MKPLTFLALAVFGYVLTGCVLNDEDALRKCQETHSYSTCVYSIHR